MPRIRNNNHNYQQHQDTSMSDHGYNSSNKRGATANKSKKSSTSFSTSFDSTPFSSYFENNDHEQWGWDNTFNDDSFQSGGNNDDHVGHVGVGSANVNTSINSSDLKMTSPSSLHSLFDYPRKAKSMIGSESKDNSNLRNIIMERKSTNSTNPITTGNSTYHQDLPNPTKIFDQVPFRNRFTSAALVSQRLHNNNNDDDDDNQPIHDFFQQSNHNNRNHHNSHIQQGDSPIPVPTQLFLTHNGTNHNKNINSKSSIPQKDNNNIISPSKPNWPTISIDENLSSSFLSNLHHHNEWPTSPNTVEDSFESFGNHSVFSDITGSITSPIRDRNKKYSIHVPSLSSRLNTSTATSATTNGEKLVDVQEEEECDDFDKGGVNHTASTHLESSYSDYGDVYDDEEEENDISSSRNSNGSSDRRKKQSRLASLFASRSLHHYNNDESKRSKSAPKQRHEESGGNTRFVSSPERSYVSGSSSSGYVGWPGTIGRDGATVPFESSFSDDGFKPIDTDSTNNENVKNNSHEAQKKQEDSHDSLQSPTTVESNKAGKIKVLGRKLFERKPSKLSGQQESDLHSSRVMALKRQYEGDVVDLDDVPSSDDEEFEEQCEKKSSHNPADVYLAKVVSRAKSASPSPCSSPVTVSDDDLKNTYSFGRSASYSKSMNKQQSLDDSIRNNNFSNNSANSNYKSMIDVSASLRRVRSALSPEALSAIPEGEDCFRLSEEALKMNERLSPTRSISGSNVKGFRGFLDKTKDVPNLMDDESDSCTSASTRATEKHLIKRTDITSWKAPGSSQSNEFDGTNSISGHSYIHHGRQVPSPSRSEQQQKTKMSSDRKIDTPTIDSEDELNVVKVNNSLMTIQTTMEHYNNRTTSAEFDANLTESDTDFLPSSQDRRIRSKNQYSIEPSWPSTLTPSRQNSTSPISDSESEFSGSRSNASLPSDTPSNASKYDLSMYVIDPSRIRKMVKRYRTLSNSVSHSPIHEDSKKAFALFEMRSRIMETDIERGIDRRGWTKVVDDIVLTPYYRASHRVRDAVVVSKAWREGASPSDARTAFYLTTGLIGSYQIKRHVRKNSSSGSVYSDISLFESNSGAFGFWNSHDYFWEKVLWVDETDFSLLRCPSLESGNLRGYDIFTEGDCQSILLKLTNDYCEVRS